MPVGDCCRRKVGAIEIGATLAAAAARMSQEQAGCLAVLDLVGMVSADDLVLHLGRELEDLGQAAKHAIDERRRRAHRERRREEFEESLTALRETLETAGREAVDFVTREFESLRDRFCKKSG